MKIAYIAGPFTSVNSWAVEKNIRIGIPVFYSNNCESWAMFIRWAGENRDD